MQPIDTLLNQVKWERIVWPDEVDTGQEWVEKRTGRRVRVEDNNGFYACVRNCESKRRSRIKLIDLCSRFTVDQETLSGELRRVPPPR